MLKIRNIKKQAHLVAWLRTIISAGAGTSCVGGGDGEIFDVVGVGADENDRFLDKVMIAAEAEDSNFQRKFREPQSKLRAVHTERSAGLVRNVHVVKRSILREGQLKESKRQLQKTQLELYVVTSSVFGAQHDVLSGFGETCLSFQQREVAGRTFGYGLREVQKCGGCKCRDGCLVDKELAPFQKISILSQNRRAASKRSFLKCALDVTLRNGEDERPGVDEHNSEMKIGNMIFNARKLGKRALFSPSKGAR